MEENLTHLRCHTHSSPVWSKQITSPEEMLSTKIQRSRSGEVSYCAQTLMPGSASLRVEYRGVCSDYENTLSSPLRIHLHKVQWSGYFRICCDAGDRHSARERYQAGWLGMSLLREAVRFSAAFAQGTPHCTLELAHDRTGQNESDCTTGSSVSGVGRRRAAKCALATHHG